MVGSAAWLEKTLGRYRLEEIVGEGGMGIVFRARDTSLGRDVALKILLGAPDATARKRFMREARAAAMLAHPNVVTIHDVGEQEGVPYVVMELVRGTSLRAFVGLPMPPSSTRLRWLIDAASALGAAHRAKLVHRDVKPENVLLSEDGVVKVVDFGIARSAHNARTKRGSPRWARSRRRARSWGHPRTWRPSTSRDSSSTAAPINSRGVSWPTSC